ncbi:EsaB/YukD family protein [Ornithinibacillus xuwenensis]|uniref:EsaB/YukD family protein n=1 Tax=Ornithinibacillus xuwenensis TaxID=3144668 RepID=A0ABU9XMP5_9BACI
MSERTHINVTFDFSKRTNSEMKYDLRIPVQLTVKHLLQNVMEIVNVDNGSDSRCAIKVLTKNLLLTDDDILSDYPITDGDIFIVL